jgi:hypothetical protein
MTMKVITLAELAPYFRYERIALSIPITCPLSAAAPLAADDHDHMRAYPTKQE